MNKRFNFPAIILLAVVILLLILIVKNRDKEPEYTNGAILERISYIEELSLVQHNYSGSITYKDYYKFMTVPVPMTKKFFLITYNGYVKAGIDMSKASVKVERKRVTVYLPKAQVFETVIDERSFQTVDESMNVLNPLRISDFQNAVTGEKKRIKNEAIKKGILTESSDKAHKFIASLLEDLGFEDVIILEIEPEPAPPINPILDWRSVIPMPQKQ